MSTSSILQQMLMALFNTSMWNLIDLLPLKAWLLPRGHTQGQGPSTVGLQPLLLTQPFSSLLLPSDFLFLPVVRPFWCPPVPNIATHLGLPSDSLKEAHSPVWHCPLTDRQTVPGPRRRCSPSPLGCGPGGRATWSAGLRGCCGRRGCSPKQLLPLNLQFSGWSIIWPAKCKVFTAWPAQKRCTQLCSKSSLEPPMGDPGTTKDAIKERVSVPSSDP